MRSPIFGTAPLGFALSTSYVSPDGKVVAALAGCTPAAAATAAADAPRKKSPRVGARDDTAAFGAPRESAWAHATTTAQASALTGAIVEL